MLVVRVDGGHLGVEIGVEAGELGRRWRQVAGGLLIGSSLGVDHVDLGAGGLGPAQQATEHVQAGLLRWGRRRLSRISSPPPAADPPASPSLRGPCPGLFLRSREQQRVVQGAGNRRIVVDDRGHAHCIDDCSAGVCRAGERDSKRLRVLDNMIIPERDVDWRARLTRWHDREEAASERKVIGIIHARSRHAETANSRSIRRVKENQHVLIDRMIHRDIEGRELAIRCWATSFNYARVADRNFRRPRRRRWSNLRLSVHALNAAPCRTRAGSTNAQRVEARPIDRYCFDDAFLRVREVGGFVQAVFAEAR